MVDPDEQAGAPLDPEAARARLTEIRAGLRSHHQLGPTSSRAGALETMTISYEMELAAHRDRMEAQIAERDATIAELRAEIGRLRQILAGITGRIAEAFAEPDVDV